MNFIVTGVHRYVVRIPNKDIYNHLGEELDGLAIESSRLILISPAVQPERREEVLYHELEHCWTWHVPPPTTEEQRCQLSATIMQSARLDLDRQGGIKALMGLKPEPLSLPYRAPALRQYAGPAVRGRNLGWRRCGQCEAKMMCGSIHTDPPTVHEGLGQYSVLRWFRCEPCDWLNIWREISTPDGKPSGVIVEIPAPKLLHARDAAEWLAEKGAVTT